MLLQQLNEMANDKKEKLANKSDTLKQLQSESEQVILGAHGASDNFMIGSSFRRGFNNSDAIIFLLGYELEKYKIGYSYDLTVSKLGMNSGGAHEISLQIQLGCFYKNPSKNNIPCPNF